MRKIGQGPYHHLDVWQHTLETLSQFELLLRETNKDAQIKQYLDEQVAGLRRRRSLLKFACILHDLGKPKAMRREKGKIIFHGHERIGLGLTRVICRRLKLSNAQSGRFSVISAIQAMTRWPCFYCHWRISALLKAG